MIAQAIASNEMESVACAGCGSNDSTATFRRPDAQLVSRCSHCGLLFLNPRPCRQVIESWYGAGYFTAEHKHSGRGYSGYFDRATARDLQKAASEKVSLISNFIGLCGASVLEVGCATGELAASLATRGANVVGCDLSDEALAVARERHKNVKFINGDISTLRLDPRSFDLLIAFEVIEHLPNPTQWIDSATQLIRSGGLLVLSTPNADCGEALGWQRWRGFQTSFEHLYFFGAKTLRSVLEHRRFNVVSIFSQGSGELPKGERFDSVKYALRQMKMFTVARSVYRWCRGLDPFHWTPGSEGHTILVLARRD